MKRHKENCNEYTQNIKSEMTCQICNEVFPSNKRSGEKTDYVKHYRSVHNDIPPEFKGNLQLTKGFITNYLIFLIFAIFVQFVWVFCLQRENPNFTAIH